MFIDEALYRAIDVWRRTENGTLVCYRCFHVLPDKENQFTGGYCVQNIDRYSSSMTLEEKTAYDLRSLRSFSVNVPLRKSRLAGSLEAAISEFRDFEQFK